MKFFMNQSIWKKIVIVLLIVLLFNAVVMKPVHADVVEFGGKLMSPILSLLVGLGDGILDVIGRNIMGSNTTLYKVERGEGIWDTVATWVVGIVTAIIAIALVVVTLGAAAVALAAIGITATVTVGLGTVVTGVVAGLCTATWFSDKVLPQDLYLPMYSYSAEEIFKGNILLFDVNFFQKGKDILVKCKDGTILNTKNFQNKAVGQTLINEHEGALYYYYMDDSNQEVKTSDQSSAAMLRSTISSWYNALRNICLVLMLSVLVYIGIRMLLSSVASDKAKYLTMLKDWFIGISLLFLMHYIMAFSVTLVEKITEVVKTAIDDNAYMVVIEADKKIKEAVEEDLQQPDAIQQENGKDFLYWPTNLMGNLRLQVQMESYGAQYIGLCLCFLMLCLFTLYFTITYLKRVLYMAFLTMIAPMVALTYCIDKLNDGQAQGFNKWFREYIFNLLIQPMHLLLYYILVASAFSLASTNVIYSIVAIGFMIPAEKLLRSLFGFEKAHTPPAMGPAGAMMASSALTHLLHKGSKGNREGKSGGADGGNDSDSDRVPMRRNEVDPVTAFLNHGETNHNGESQPHELDDEGETWQNHIENPQNQLDESPQGGTNPYQRGNTELDEEGQQLLDNINNPQNQIDTPYQDSNPYQIGNTELDDEGEAWQNYIENSQNQLDNTHERLAQPSEEGQQQPTREESIEFEPNEEEKPSKGGARRRIRRMAHASWEAQKTNMRNTPRKLKRNLENAHPIRTMGKIAAGTILGTAAGAVGLAIAASSGDLSNVAKIGGGAVAGGFALGSGMAKNIKSPMQDETVQKVRDDAYNKGEYKPDAMNDYVKRFRKDPKVKAYLEATCGKQDAKEMLGKNGEVEQYLNNNITDVKEMKAMHKLKKEGVVKNVEEAISISKLGTMIGKAPEDMTDKKKGEWKTTIGSMAGQEGVKDTKKFAEDRFNQIQKLYDFKK